MKRFFLSLSLSLLAALVIAGNIYLMERGGKAVFSTTNDKGETVTATNSNFNSILRPEQSSFTLSIPIKGFAFEDYLLVDQFASKNYLNAEKEALIRYDGKIEETGALQLKKLAEKTVKVSGKIRINGIEKDLNTSLTLKKTDEGVSGSMSLKDIQLSQFDIEPSEAIKTQFGEVIQFECEVLWKELEVQKK